MRLMLLCALLGLASVPAAAQSQLTAVEEGEYVWRHMMPNRFPATEAAWRTKCATLAAVTDADLITPAWCDTIISSYLTFRATGVQGVCRPSLELDGTRYRFGMTGDISSPQVVLNMRKQLGRSDPATRCTHNGVTAVFFDEPNRGCNNLHIAAIVFPEDKPRQSRTCAPNQIHLVTPGRIVVTPPLIANGSVNLSGTTTVFPPSITTQTRLTGCN